MLSAWRPPAAKEGTLCAGGSSVELSGVRATSSLSLSSSLLLLLVLPICATGPFRPPGPAICCCTAPADGPRLAPCTPPRCPIGDTSWLGGCAASACDGPSAVGFGAAALAFTSSRPEPALLKGVPLLASDEPARDSSCFQAFRAADGDRGSVPPVPRASPVAWGAPHRASCCRCVLRNAEDGAVGA